MPYTKKLLAAVGKIIDRLPNRVSISGHTDGSHAQRRTAARTGNCPPPAPMRPAPCCSAAAWRPDRIYEVAGKAGSEPLLPEDPNASANRRLSILLLREAPPAPPGTSL